MDLIPAVDLLGGEAVRLVEGRFTDRAGRHADPRAAVSGWVRDGVRHLHLVDLDGARTGRPANLPMALSLAESVRAIEPSVRVQLGGGLREAGTVAAVLDAGIDLAILGTAAATPAHVAELAARWPDRIGASIDVRDGALAVEGWTRTVEADPAALAAELAAAGVGAIVVTDVRRDGTGRGPNVELVTRIREAAPAVRLLAAGGIAGSDQLRSLAAAGADGAIVGLALLDGSLSVRDALAVLAAPMPR